jgi:hypothetical protein
LKGTWIYLKERYSENFLELNNQLRIIMQNNWHDILITAPNNISQLLGRDVGVAREVEMVREEKWK